MGFEFKPKLSAILAVVHATSAALAYIATQTTSQPQSSGSPYPQA